jgi:alginate O-acetyltransferase complex protein AlgI
MIFFLPLALIVYWLLPARRLAQNTWLLACSYAFYASWSVSLLALLVAGTLLDFAVGRYLADSAARADAASILRRRAALFCSLGFSLGALAFFKYEGFFAGSLNQLLAAFNLRASLPVLHLLLPLGISFYTLQRVGYILDVYWNRHAGCASLLDFALFTSYFPQVTAGPISRASELLPQLGEARRWSPDLIAKGTNAYLLGYALKAWAGNTIGQQIVDPVFTAGASYSAFSHWLAIFSYAAQVFCDFAGYSLIAIGLSQAFGITLPQNFNFPFLSRSLPELWRRWHITLNRWLFDYIFTPLTTSDGWFRGRLDLALVLTFLASGLWHGANWTFIAWGVMHGLGMVIQRNWDERYRRWCRVRRSLVDLRRSRGYILTAWLLTQMFFVLSLIPFRAPDIHSAFAFLTDIGSSTGTQSIPAGVNATLALAFVVAYHLQELPWLAAWRRRIMALPDAVRGFAYGSAVAFLLLQTPPGSGVFIYQQF